MCKSGKLSRRSLLRSTPANDCMVTMFIWVRLGRFTCRNAGQIRLTQ